MQITASQKSNLTGFNGGVKRRSRAACLRDRILKVAPGAEVALSYKEASVLLKAIYAQSPASCDDILVNMGASGRAPYLGRTLKFIH